MIPHTSLVDATRDFTVAVFVVCQERVLLHKHRKLGRWLPPGGHIEPNELPDDAAIREVAEESGLVVSLTGGKGLPQDYEGEPIQLVIPAGIQLEVIGDQHEHIDLVYFAVIADAPPGQLPVPDAAFRWLSLEDLDSVPVSAEVRDWCYRAVREVSG